MDDRLQLLSTHISETALEAVRSEKHLSDPID